MAALYLHNSIWVSDAADTPRGHSLHTRTTSSATIQTLQTEQSHPSQPLLPTSESVAYLDLLSHQPTHPNDPRGSPMGLSFEGDPTTMRERKGYADKLVRRRLRRLKVVMAVLEVIMVCWSLYTTVRYFLAYAIYSSKTGQVVALVLGATSTVSFAVLFAAAVTPLLRIYLLGQNISIEVLLTVRMILRYLASFLLFGPGAVNFALVFAWRSSSSAALNMGNRCYVDIDVVWSIRSHSSCTPPPWGAWLALAIVRLLVTIAVLSIYHLSLASYRQVRRPSLQHRHHPSITSESTVGSPPTSGTPLPLSSGHIHQTSNSTLGSTSRPTMDHRSLRSSRGSSLNHNSPSAPENLRLPRLGDSPRSSNEGGLQDDFDPYADLPPLPSGAAPAAPGAPSESDRELYSFVDRFRSLVSQITREAEDAAYLGPDVAGPSTAPRSYPPAVAYDEFGRAYPPDDYVRVLNSYIRRMPTIESVGSRAGTTSIATSSLYQEQLASLHTLSRPPTRAMTDRDSHPSPSEPPSRAGSLILAAAELMNAMGADGMSEVGMGELVDRVRRTGSVGSATGTSPSISGVSFYTASPMATPIMEEPMDILPPPPPPPALRPLPRPPGLPRADSV